VKKIILSVTGFAVVLTAAYFGSGLFAQGTGAPAGGAAQPQGTKIAVINIGYVFNNYDRAKAFKKNLELAVGPYKDKGKAMADDIKKWEGELAKPGIDQKVADNYRASIIQTKRKLEDMGIEMQKLLGKQQEDNLVTLWKEVNMGIGKVAEAYGFQIVLGYGDPMDKALLDQFPNVNRKMQAMDLGSTCPLYVHGSVDLSYAVTETLNRWLNPTPAPKGGTVTPASGTK
jgi:Skp family chaperone for outer membrane proteins